MKPLKTDPPAQPSSDCVNSHTFIVRIWQDTSAASGGAAWRGLIDHVGCDRHLVFFDLDSIAGFVQEQTGLTANRRPPWWRALIQWIRRHDR